MKEISEVNTYCYRHKRTQTRLRCVQCPRPICVKCAILTPGGYKCQECIKALKARVALYNGRFYDYLLVPLVVLPLALGVTVLFYLVGTFVFSTFIALIAAPWVVGQIARAVRWSVRYRRPRYLAQVAAICFVTAVVPFVLADLIASDFFSLATTGCLLILGTRTMMVQLS